MRKLVKIETTAGVKKHFFDVSKIVDVATATSADRRLAMNTSPTFNTRGLYTEQERELYTNNPDLFIGTLRDTPAHPNGAGFAFSVTDWWQTIESAVKTGISFLTTASTPVDGVFRVPRSLVTLLDEDGDDITLAAGELGAGFDMIITRASGSNRAMVADVASGAGGLEVSLSSIINTSRTITGVKFGSTADLHRQSGVGSVRIQQPYTIIFDSIDIGYALKTISITERGYGFGTPSTARFDFPAGSSLSDIHQSPVGASVTFGVEAFQRQNKVNVTLNGVSTAKGINLSEERWEEELDKWLNKGLGRDLSNVIQGFHVIKEDE